MSERLYDLINNSLGWLLFVIGLFIYFSTLEPTVSLWDCGEIIAAAYKLQVIHPPGAPSFLMLGRFFSLFAPTEEWVPFMMNGISAISTALSMMLLFWTITALARKIVLQSTNSFTQGHIIGIMGSGLIGGLAFAFTDTSWFSGVEAERYALSNLFQAMFFWLMLKWERRIDRPGNIQYLVLIAFVIGLSIGVHLMSLLVVPALAVIYYVRKYENPNWFGALIATGIGLLVLGVIYVGIIKTLPDIAAQIELLFVNTFGLPFWSGIFFTLLLLLGLTIYGIYYSYVNKKVILNLSLTCLLAVLMGYSTYSMVVIRSNANPSLDMNNPDNVFNLISYINREQYGSRPLLYGQHFAADPVGNKRVGTEYIQTEDGYEATGPKMQREFAAEDKMLFPRMADMRGDRKRAYRQWVGLQQGEDPSFADNLEFFFKYQVGHMYWRYFAWNFIGRQNDIQGHGGPLHGNWLTGISFIDEAFANVGPQENLPKFLKDNRARNELYGLPFLLGLLGMFFHFKNHKWDSFSVLVFFIMTGLMLVIYLNNPPREPRERDYTLAGSFYAFSIWVGIGVMQLIEWLKNYMKPSAAGVVATFAALLLVPGIMAKEEWNDHDRSERYTTIDFAKNHLKPLDSNAVLFTFGDNETYPLWYAQEVEGYRTDVRVINMNLMNAKWYINHLRLDFYESEGLQFNNFTADKINRGERTYIQYQQNPNLDQDRYYDLDRVLQFIASDKQNTKARTRQGRVNYLPTKKIKIDVDKEKVLKSNVVDEKYSDRILDEVKFKIPGNSVMLQQLTLLDLIASTNWTRPIYFSVQTPSSNYLNLDDYFIQEGLAYKLAPVETPSNTQARKGMMDNEKMYDALVNDFKWGGLPDSSLYLGYVTRRHCKTYRSHFAQLSRSLIQEGEEEKAEKVLDECFRVFPNQQVAYDARVTPLVRAYYQIDALEKAKKQATELSDNLIGNVEYLTSMPSYMRNQGNVKSTLRNSMAGLNQLSRAASNNGHDSLAQDINNVLQRYQGGQRRQRPQQQRQRPQPQRQPQQQPGQQEQQ